MFVHSRGCIKGSQIEKVIIVQTHVDVGRKRGFYLFPPKAVIYANLTDIRVNKKISLVDQKSKHLFFFCNT
jgi:hypothetical protein